MEQQKNNFNLLRFGLASAVVLAHVTTLTQIKDYPAWMYFFTGDWAVKSFFVISGYLITLSFIQNPNWRVFLEKRARRIFPAYLAAIALCLALGIGLTRLSAAEFWTHPQTLKYIVSNLLFLNFLQGTLPGVFQNNPHLPHMDGSLWTIKLEITLYALTPLFVWVAARKKRMVFDLLIAAIFLFGVTWAFYFNNSMWQYADLLAHQFPAYMPFYFAGAAVAVAVAKKTTPEALYIITFLLAITKICFPDFPIGWEYLTIPALTLLFALKLPPIPFIKSDISYGTYLFHFPIIQTLWALGIFRINIYLGLILAFGVTYYLAAVSWHFLEKPILKR